MRTSSLAAVMSPWMSITRTGPEGSRTSNVVAASGMVAPFRAVDGAALVVGDRHEVGQACDLEDLAVVVRQAERRDLDPAGARLGQEAHDQRDPGAVDVAGGGEVQGDRADVARGFVVGTLQHSLGGRIDVADQVQDRHAAVLAHGYLELMYRHRRLLAGARRARASAGFRRRSRAPRRPSSRSGTAPSRAASARRRAWPPGREP